MTKKWFCFIALVVAVGSTEKIIGATDLPGKKAHEMGTVVVTATRYEESVFSVPANVTVIGEKEIKNSASADIPELLRTISGIHVSDISGNRRNYMVDLRGFGETAAMNTLVLVDGRRSNQADLSGVDWSQIPLDRVERIEIIRGGRASVLYGDNAAGGVINIITQKGETFKTGGEISGGSYDTYRANAFIRGAGKNITYAFSSSYMDSDGYRDNSETEAKDFGADFGYLFGEWGNMNLSFGYHEDDTGLPGALKRSDLAAGAHRTDTVQPIDFADTKDYYIKAGPEIYLLENSLLKCDISFRNRDVTNYASGDWGSFEGGFEIETVSVSPQMVVSEKIFEKTNRLTLGLDYTNAKEDITNTSEFFGFISTAKVDMEKKNTGFFIHDEFMILPDLGISAGYRYDRARYEFSSSERPEEKDNTTVDEELFTTGANYRMGARSNIYASFSRSFRYPALDELFNFYMNEIVSDLRPQVSDDIEIGFRYAFTDALNATVNLFHIETEDEIFYNLNSYSNENMDGDTKRYGVEVSVVRDFLWGNTNLSYTYTRAEIDGGQFDNSDIPNVPEHQAAFNVLVDYWKPFTIAVNGTYIGERPFISDFNNNYSDQEDYVVVNAKIVYRLKNISTFLNLNNLFNKEYDEYGVLGGFPTEQAFYPSPKAHFMIGISLDI